MTIPKHLQRKTVSRVIRHSITAVGIDQEEVTPRRTTPRRSRDHESSLPLVGSYACLKVCSIEDSTVVSPALLRLSRHLEMQIDCPQLHTCGKSSPSDLPETKTSVMILISLGVPSSSKLRLTALPASWTFFLEGCHGCLELLLKLELAKEEKALVDLFPRHRTESTGWRKAMCAPSICVGVITYSDAVSNGKQSAFHPEEQRPGSLCRPGSVELRPLLFRGG